MIVWINSPESASRECFQDDDYGRTDALDFFLSHNFLSVCVDYLV